MIGLMNCDMLQNKNKISNPSLKKLQDTLKGRREISVKFCHFRPSVNPIPLQSHQRVDFFPRGVEWGKILNLWHVCRVNVHTEPLVALKISAIHWIQCKPPICTEIPCINIFLKIQRVPYCFFRFYLSI